MNSANSEEDLYFEMEFDSKKEEDVSSPSARSSANTAATESSVARANTPILAIILSLFPNYEIVRIPYLTTFPNLVHSHGQLNRHALTHLLHVLSHARPKTVLSICVTSTQFALLPF